MTDDIQDPAREPADGTLGEEEVAAADPTSIVPARETLPRTLLLIPLHDRPIFPGMVGPVLIGDDGLKGVLLEGVGAAAGGETTPEIARFVGLVLVETEGTGEAETPAQEGGATASVGAFPKIGVVARVLRASPMQPGLPMQLLVQALERFEIIEILSDAPAFRASVRYRPESGFETNEEIKAYSLAIIDNIKELIQLNPLYKEGLSLILDKFNVNNPGLLADFAASMTTATGAELQRILETRSIRSRIEQALVLLHKEIEISKLKARIGRRIEERLSKQQREFFLKEQLKEIKRELGIRKEDTETELEKFRARLERLVLPEEARERVEQELDKLSLLEPASPEFSVTRAYLDWLTELPWGVYTEDNYDIAGAARILDEDHFGLDDVKERILELISVGIVKGDLAGSIILLVGPPGVGKTSIGRSVARALGRKFYRFSLGGMRDEAEIKGHRRTYIGALPGKFIQAIKTCRTANPLIMLDEIDKIGASFHGDPASALLEVLDPEQNRDFLDHYLDVRFDLSKVLFLCTANQVETIPRPLLDRMETIRLSGYTLEDKLEIARGFLIPKQLERHGLTRKQVAISRAVVRGIVEGYAREAGVRSLENCIKKILRKAARAIVEKHVTRYRVRVRDLPALLGRPIFAQENAFRKPRVGVVTGLAYTALGGTTLHIEAAAVTARNAGFKQTGQLGDVMVESSEIAYTYVRSRLKDDGEARKFFERHLVHLHVPAGATPKDGPSAGITMACALYSLAIGRPITPGIAMTGELTLTGLVMPIGGLKEKVIAAKRAGVMRLIFPAENRPGFEELDEAIREGIEGHFVRTFEEVRRIAFPAR